MRLLTTSLLSVAIGLSPLATFAADTTISDVRVSPSDATPSAQNTLSVTFTTSGITDTANVTVGIFTPDGSVTDYSFDYSAVTGSAVVAASPDLSSYSTTVDVNSDTTYFGTTFDAVTFQLDSAMPAGTYTINIPGIVNPSTESTYAVGVSTASEAALLSASNYTHSDAFSISNPPIFNTTALTGLQVKNITKFEALLKWVAFDTTDFDVTYTVKVVKKNGDGIKTFSGLTDVKKQLTKASGLLKPGKSYKFKVRACNVDDETVCTDWSALKSFTLKAAE